MECIATAAKDNGSMIMGVIPTKLEERGRASDLVDDIAQYEKNARTPNAETTAKLAEVLKVSPVVFSPTTCASREDLLQSMYWLFLMKGGGDIYDCETEYARRRMEQKLGVITVEELLEKILAN